MAIPTRVVTRGSMTTAESGGIIIYDDCGYPSCPGARRAGDEFYADKPERPLVLNTGQAIVTRLR